MKNNIVTILHIIVDDKFFDSTIALFESDYRLKNICILYASRNDYKFKYIKSAEKVIKVSTEKELKSFFLAGKYDVVYFHSLDAFWWKYVSWIPKDKIVIWWAWGFDIYNTRVGTLPPFIKCDQFLPLTKQLVNGNQSNICESIRNVFRNIYYGYYRRKMISRVDYFQPIIPFEFELMKLNKGFHAKKFYYPVNNPMQFINCKKNNSVLIGNSSYPSNNHLDIMQVMSNKNINGLKFIMPMNYGDCEYRKIVTSNIELSSNDIEIITDFIPLKEYELLLSSCVSAVFGSLRQQALGNIFRCLCYGVKLFFFRDSLLYKYFSSEGYFVYAIEDITQNILSSPLSHDQAMFNYSKYISFVKYRNNKYNDVIQKINNQMYDI